MQSRMSSLVEQILNVGSGFIISLIVWIYLIIPIFSIQTQFGDNLMITGMFTVISVIRGYCFRRLFNWIHYKRNA